MWDKTKIMTQNTFKEGIAPLLISASRSTDIPAFHAEWFMKRLHTGYVKWINPFNRKAQYVSLDKVRFIVFWTKNPKPMIPFLDELKSRGISFYFQYTLNNYDLEGLEPKVPPISERIDTFLNLSDKIGKEKVIWRSDPLLLSDSLHAEDLLERINTLGNTISTHTEKLVFSFIDINQYPKVKKNLETLNAGYREFSESEMTQFSSNLVTISSKWNIELTTCGEKINLSNLGIEHNKCIDDKLILRIAPNDKQICQLLGCTIEQGSLLPFYAKESKARLKDKGQRKECGCIVSKDIGQYNTCMHLCKYCYANHSEALVKRNASMTSTESETIIIE